MSKSEYSILAGLVAHLVYQNSKANIVATGIFFRRLNIYQLPLKISRNNFNCI